MSLMKNCWLTNSWIVLLSAVSVCSGGEFSVGTGIERHGSKWHGKSEVITSQRGVTDTAIWIRPRMKLSRAIATDRTERGSHLGVSYAYRDDLGRLVSRTIHFGIDGMFSRAEAISHASRRQLAESGSTQVDVPVPQTSIRAEAKSASQAHVRGRITH